ncbi:hypothetical protein [Brevundimonas sp.]|uniref:hypothetical protein n=1 Tax=Brevundimonas sp. TaxID=1871086 RepID=UPI002737EB2C|nr:hypothetical protein [Brevundimonas sp.]MDP3801373.1 hypothetical protein [Brevundimonas sp.]
MSLVVPIAAALFAAWEAQCGVVDLPHIDRASYAVVNGMTASAGADGRVSTAFFAEPLASALEAEYGRRDRGEALRLARDWLTGGGRMEDITGVSLYILNRSGVDDTVMRLGFINAEGRQVYRRLHLRCENGRWRISSIFLHPEDAFLNDLLARKP